MKPRPVQRRLTLLAFVVAAAIPLALLTKPQALTAQRIPGLDFARVLSWVDDHRVVARAYADHATEEGLDLATGKTFAVPGLERHSYWHPFTIGKSYPYPSPDGRWLLYIETDNTKEVDDKTVKERLRLASIDGGKDRTIPASGNFDLSLDTVAWLPDSSGFVAVHFEPHQAVNLSRIDLDKGHVGPSMRLSVPFDARFVKVDPPTLSITPREELVVCDPSNPRLLRFYPLRDGAQGRSVKLSLPRDALIDATDVVTTDRRGFVLLPDGRSVLVCVEVPDGRFTAWMHRLLHRPQTRWEFQRIPLDGGEPQTVFSVDQRVGLFYLSADGKSLVYRLWRVKKASGTDRDRYQGPAYWVRLP